MQQEYERKPSLPIPFSIFENLYVLLGEHVLNKITTSTVFFALSLALVRKTLT